MKSNDEKQLETATSNLLASFYTPHPRRKVLKGAVAGIVAGATLSTSTLTSSGTVQAHRATMQTPETHSGNYTSPSKILDIAVTAERLAVTFYSNAIANATILGLNTTQLSYLQAALVEEQIHEQFFESLGALSLTSTFSFSDGAETFTSVHNVIQTQQQLEGVFDAAFLAGVFELAQQNHAHLAQSLAQIAVVEGEHRVLGRIIGDEFNLPGYELANDRAYSPVLVARVADTPAIVEQAGYLSPTPGNTFSYVPVNIAFPGINYRTPFAIRS